MESNWLDLMYLIKNNHDSENNYKALLKEIERYDELTTEKKNDINFLSKKNDYDNLTYYFSFEKTKPLSTH